MKKFTLLIVVASILALVGFASMAYATVAPTKSIDGKAAILEGGVVVGQTIETAKMTRADQVVAQKIEVQKTGGIEAQAPMEIVAAESVPKYTMLRTEGIAIAASLISLDNITTKDVGKMGGVTSAWTNGGGPTVGTAPMVATETMKIQNMKKTGTVVLI